MRTTLVGRERQQRVDFDDDDAASTTYFEMTERPGAPATGGSADECESSPARDRVPPRRSAARSAGLYVEPLKDPPPSAGPPDYSKDWKRMAEIVDRLFFWLFLLATTLSTLVLLHPLLTLLTETRTNADVVHHN